MADTQGRKLIKVSRNGDEWKFKWSQGMAVLDLTSTERPLPELAEELDGLHKFAIEASPYIAESYQAQTIVSGVTHDWKGDDNRRNAVVHLTIKAGAHGFVKVSTPKKLADSNLDEKKKGRWDTNAVAQFDKLEQQAFAYIDGQRSQQVLPIIEKGDENQGQIDFNDEMSA